MACSKAKKKKSPPDEQVGDRQTGKNELGQFEPGNAVGKEHWWKPGQSGNPKGRTKGLDLTNALQRLLNQPLSQVPFVKTQCEKLGIDFDPKDKTTKVLEAVIASTVCQVLLGKSEITKQVFDRMEGSVKQHIGLNEDDPVAEYLKQMDETTEPPRPPGYKERKTTRPVKKKKKVRVTKRVKK